MNMNPVNNSVKWTPGYIRTNMTMWNTLIDDPVNVSMPLLFKTTIVKSNAEAETHLRLGYYDANAEAFIESGYPNQHYRDTVMWWYQFPMPPTAEPTI